jgi:hypothetical protein
MVGRSLSRLFLFHAAITFAAAVVLVLSPALIPGTVGVQLDRSGYLLSYLLAGAELGFALLSFRAASLTDPDALRAIVSACVTFHAATAALEVFAVMRGASHLLWANAAARGVIVGLFLYFGPGRSPRG